MTDILNYTNIEHSERGDIKWHLLLRVERPIEGCELSPHPYLKIKGGSLDNSARAKLLDSTPHCFTYQWKRGPYMQICANITCPRGDTFDPINWSRFSLGSPGLQCMVCYLTNGVYQRPVNQRNTLQLLMLHCLPNPSTRKMLCSLPVVIQIRIMISASNPKKYFSLFCRVQ